MASRYEPSKSRTSYRGLLEDRKGTTQGGTRSGVNNVINNRGTRIYHIQEPAPRLGKGKGQGIGKEEEKGTVVLEAGDAKYRGTARAFTYAQAPRSPADGFERPATRRTHSPESHRSSDRDRRWPYRGDGGSSTSHPHGQSSPWSERAL